MGGHSTNLWSCGLGVKYSDIKLDFAYLGGQKNQLNNRLMLTLSFDY